MKRIATILSFVFLVISQSKAQYFQSTNFKEGSGLPSSESYMAFQDSRGFIWIATDNGVIKYDGHEFVNYNTKDGLTDNTVFGFFEDHKGRIWFRTYNGLLSYYESDSIESYKYNAQLKAFNTSALLATIEYNEKDELLFSTVVHAQFGKIDSAGNVSRQYGTTLDLDNIASTADEDGTRWYFVGFVVDKVLVAPTKMPREVKTIRIDGKAFDIDIDDQSTQSHWQIASAKWKGKYYFSFHQNLFSYDGQSIKKMFTAKHPILSLYVDREDRLWAGYFNDGVMIFNDESMRPSQTLLSELSVSSVMQDYEGGMWLSTLDQGVFYFPNLTISNYRPPNDTRVSAVAYGDNEIFLGNYSGEVFGMNQDGKLHSLTKNNSPVTQLFLDSEKKLWISDASGTRIHPTGTRIVSRHGSGSQSFKVLIQSNDVVYGANGAGIFKMSLKGDIIGRTEARRRPISMAMINDSLYVGELNRLEKMHASLDGPAVTIGTGRTSSLQKLDDRYLAVGTIGDGLFIYDSKTEILSPMPVADVVNIYSIITDWPARRIWIGTDKGLFQLKFSNNAGEPTLEHFSKADGLVSNKISKVCRMGDNIWTITDLGISSVPLEQFTDRDTVPKFYINRIMFENESIMGNAISIRTEEQDMVLDVRAITFKGRPTMFRYRLNATDPWRMVSGGSIFLTDMKPNIYHIEVQASLDNETWTKSLTTQIDVIAQWWDTWAFRWSVIFVICVLGYVTYLLRINAIRRKHKYLELINHHQQKLIDSEIRTQERERKRIATDLHDGIGASLSSIKMQMTDAMLDDERDRSARAKEINDHLTDVIDDIKRIVYDLHPPGLERYGLQSGLKNLVERINKSSDVNVIFDYYGQRDIIQPVSITIFRILQELLNNTLKHARASEIRIHINEFDDEINIMYEDNGIGMIGSRFTGLGLHSIESRVRSLNGRMSWESNHKGTFYNFDIPF